MDKGLRRFRLQPQRTDKRLLRRLGMRTMQDRRARDHLRPRKRNQVRLFSLRAEVGILEIEEHEILQNSNVPQYWA